MLGNVCLVITGLGNETSQMECKSETGNRIEYIHRLTGDCVPYYKEKECEYRKEIRREGDHQISYMVSVDRIGHHTFSPFGSKGMYLSEKKHPHQCMRKFMGECLEPFPVFPEKYPENDVGSETDAESLV